MKEWRNPYITLSLSPFATNAEIFKRVNLIGGQDPENDHIARSAKERLSHNLELIFPAFLTAVPDPVFIGEDLKTLRKYNRRPVKLDDKSLRDAFQQLGLPMEEHTERKTDLSKEVYLLIKEEVGLHQHMEAFQQTREKEGVSESEDVELHAETKSVIPIPLIIKD